MGTGGEEVALTHLLADEFGMTIARAKGTVDLVLERSEFSESREPESVVALREPVWIEIPVGSDPVRSRQLLEELGLLVEDAT